MQDIADSPALLVSPTTPLLALIRDWRLFRMCCIAGGILAVVIVALIGPRYTTTVGIVPQAARSGQLRGLAAQFGFDIAGSEGDESLFFYVELVKTQALLSRVVKHDYDQDGRRGDYAPRLSISIPRPIRQSALTRRLRPLRNAFNLLADRRTSS